MSSTKIEGRSKSSTIILTVAFIIQLSAVSSKPSDTGRPCLFHDSINISSGYQDKKGNYHHNGITYGPEFYAEFDFVYLNDTLVNVEPHTRGCICALMGSCLRFCEYTEEPMVGYLMNPETGEVTARDLTKVMAAVYGAPYCPLLFAENVTVTTNGDLYDGGEYYTRNQYCVTSMDNETVAVFCGSETAEPIIFSFYPVGEYGKCITANTLS